MRIYIHTGMILALFAIMITGVSCSSPDAPSEDSIAVEHGCARGENLPESRPDDFNILFRYGYGSVNKNELNTFNGTYTKDMGADPPVTIDFSLSDEKMDDIYQKMVEIDFFCFPDEFVMPVSEDGTVCAVTPYQGYYFKVACNGNVKVLRWEDNIVALSHDATELRNLIRIIRGFIEYTDEYRELPEPQGLYL